MKTIKKIIFTVFALLTTFAITLWIAEWWTGTYYYEFQLGNKYLIDLKADNCGTCLLDLQVDYELKLQSLKSQEEHNFQFWMEGKQIQFYLSEKKPELILLVAIDDNDYPHWVVNLKNNNINQVSLNDTTGNGFFPVYKLTGK